MLSRTPCKLLWISLVISLLRFSSALEWSSLYLAWWSFSWHLLLGSNVPFTERQPLSRPSKVTHHNVLCHLIIFFSTAHAITWSYVLCIYSCIYIYLIVCLFLHLIISLMMSRLCLSFSVLYPQHIKECLAHIRHSISILLIKWINVDLLK